MRFLRLGCLLVWMAAAPAAAVDWTEQGDAPSFPDGVAQETTGDGVLDTVSGATGDDDRRDAYCITITDPEGFRASTDPAVDARGSATFDTELYLFDAAGEPVLQNDDSTLLFGPSTITPPATDGGGAVIPGPGPYVIVVSSFNDVPEDTGGQNLFSSAGATAVNGPNPARGPFASWNDAGSTAGAYTIAFLGAATCDAEPEPLPVPASTPAGRLGLALLLLVASGVLVGRRSLARA